MNDKRIFIDSNIILYIFTDNISKKEKAATLLTSNNHIVSTQVINENVNVCLRKLKLSKEEAYAHGRNLLDKLTVVNIYPSAITSAFDLSIKYMLGFWDSLIIATALENDCEVLLSEDLNNGQVIENRIKIVNPFVSND